ncbi:MAG: hypothetical protein ACFB5Z_09460 [Elainellaceae cyanobacterium]
MRAHFVALYAHPRAGLLGEVFNGEIQLNASGQAIRSYWLALPQYHPCLHLDEFAITPSGIRGILLLDAATMAKHHEVEDIIDEFKARSNQQISRMYQRIDPPIWQRNVYRLDIRNETSLQILRYYTRFGSMSQQCDER